MVLLFPKAMRLMACFESFDTPPKFHLHENVLCSLYVFGFLLLQQ